MAHFTGINHLAMATSDMDATIRYWRDLLGMRLVAGLGHEGYRHYFFEISPTDMIAFFEWPGVRPVPEKDHGVPVKGPAVFDHLSFGVQGPDDLWEIKDALEAAGFWVSEAVDHGFIHSIYSFDPNGIAVEFSVVIAAADVHAHPRMTDTHPTPGALEGPAPQTGKWPPVRTPTPPDDRVVYPGEGEIFLRDSSDKWNPGNGG